eukprot:COSAG05_NODE_1579_length_4497_cov_4.735789_3_plen_527_part_00
MVLRGRHHFLLLAPFVAHGGAVAPPAPPVVDCIAGLWDAPPSNAPTAPNNAVSNGAFTGNGDLGVVVGAAPKAPTTLAFYMDLMQFRCPSIDGVSKCNYGSGGHAGVGWLGVDVQGAGTRTAFSMQQLVRTAEVTSQSTFSAGIVLSSRLVAFSSENLAVVELWFNQSTDLPATAPPQKTLSLVVSDEMYQTGKIMACRTNKAGQHADSAAATCRGRGSNCTGSSRSRSRSRSSSSSSSSSSRGEGGGDDTPPWQWGESWLGRGFQDHRAFPSAHHDVFPLTSRVEHVVMATAFGGDFISRTNASSNFDGKLGYRSWSTVNIAEGQVLRLSTQLWTERDFNFTRDPMAAAAQSMRSVVHPAHIAKLEAAHAKWWTEYWSRSSISMPSARRTELFWYGAVYMWGTANRANWTAHMPAAGLWKNHYTGNDYGWPAYTTDINTQAPYFATYGCNRVEIPSAMYLLAPLTSQLHNFTRVRICAVLIDWTNPMPHMTARRTEQVPSQSRFHPRWPHALELCLPLPRNYSAC